MKSVATLLAILLLTDVFGNAVARSKSKRMPVEPIQLYYLPPSPPCRAVMMLARALDLELDLIPTNILEGDHMTPEYLKMNPQHTIPTMDDNGFILWESRAILAYLVNAYGKDDSLYPKNPRLRGLVDQRLNFDVGTLFPRYANLYVCGRTIWSKLREIAGCKPVSSGHCGDAWGRPMFSNRLLVADDEDSQSVKLWRQAPMLFRGEAFNQDNADKLNEALGWLNTFLEKSPFVAGENMSIADISIVVTITNLKAFDYDLSAFDNVTKWFERTKKELEPFGYEDIDELGAQILADFLKSQQ